MNKPYTVTIRITEEEKKFLDEHGKSKALRRSLEIYMRRIREVERELERINLKKDA